MRCYIFDIDGTLANGEHRLHHIRRAEGDQTPKDWDSYHKNVSEDAPIWHMIDICKCLMTITNIVFITGRPERNRIDTVIWLGRYGLLGDLRMRANDDHRDDNVLKIEILANIRNEGYQPVMAFDDRTRVVRAYRAVGIPCCQVTDGDF